MKAWWLVSAIIGLSAGCAWETSAFAAPRAGCAERRALTPQAPLRGVWVSNVDSWAYRSERHLRTAMEKIRVQGFNTVYPVVWNRGAAFFRRGASQDRFLKDLGPSPFVEKDLLRRDVLDEAIYHARGVGLQIIPWFEYGFRVHGTSPLVRERPELFSRKKNGELFLEKDGFKFAQLNPFHPEAQGLIIGLILDVLTQYEVDGIQIDDHFSLPPTFGYDVYTVALYRKEHGGKGPPQDWKDREWTLWRAGKFTGFMRKLSKEIHRVRPRAKLVLSPNYWEYALAYQLQDWRKWVSEGLIDELVIQVYNKDKEDYVELLNRQATQAALKCIPVSVGFIHRNERGKRTLSPSLPVKEMIRISTQRGFDGFALFHFGNLSGSTYEVTSRIDW